MARLFSNSDRHAMRMIAGNHCEICGVELDASFHADHVEPYSKGGVTELENGQALCSRCNLRKGSKIMNTNTNNGASEVRQRETPKQSKRTDAPSSIASFEWQQECLGQIGANREQGATDFLVSAYPGSGKTRLALADIREQLDADAIDLAIVVVPSDALRTAWAVEANDFGIPMSAILDGRSMREIQAAGPHRNIVGYVMTAQGLSNSATIVDALCLRYRVQIIVDEIHHMAETNAWGASLNEATAHAAFRLGLSGTPWRTKADGKIPILRYVESKGLPCYEYGYERALKDEIATHISFHLKAGTVTHRAVRTDADGSVIGEPIEEVLNFADLYENDGKLDEQRHNLRLNIALNHQCEFGVDLVLDAHEMLKQIRADGDADAGGLVVARDKKHATKLCAALRRAGASAVRVTEDDSRVLITEFAKSDIQWIVAVHRISEGVNIPRLRVLAYATYITTNLYFVQAVMRIGRRRWTMPQESQAGAVFMPRDPRLESYAREMSKIIAHDIEQGKKDVKLPPAIAIARTSTQHYVVGSEMVDAGGIFNGRDVTIDEIKIAKQEQTCRPRLRNLDPIQLAVMLREYKLTD